MGKLRVSKLRLYPPVGIQDMHHNVRREWLAKASCHTFVRGKGTLFANFPSWALTGCFVFRPLLTSMASRLLVQVKCFPFFSSCPHCKAAVIRAIRSTSHEQRHTGWRILDGADAPYSELLLPGRSWGQTALRADGSQSFPRQGDAIDSTAPKSDKMGMRQSFINIRTKRSCVLHSILVEIRKCQSCKGWKRKMMIGQKSGFFF